MWGEFSQPRDEISDVLVRFVLMRILFLGESPRLVLPAIEPSKPVKTDLPGCPAGT